MLGCSWAFNSRVKLFFFAKPDWIWFCIHCKLNVGSVNGANCKELAGQPDMDGFLVGGASLKVSNCLSLLLSFDAFSSDCAQLFLTCTFSQSAWVRGYHQVGHCEKELKFNINNLVGNFSFVVCGVSLEEEDIRVLRV